MTAPLNGQLPTELIRKTNWRHLAGSILTLVATALLLVFGFAGLLSAEPELGNPTYNAFVTQWQRLKGPSARVETLILGDSSGRHGVDPKVIDEVLHTTSVNVCTIGSAGLINVAWQIEAYLARHPVPRRVLIVHVYDLWRREIELPLMSHVPLPWGYWNRMRVSPDLDDETTWDLFLERYVPVLSQNKIVVGIAMRPWDPPRWKIKFDQSGFSAIRNADPEIFRKDVRGQMWTATHLEFVIGHQSREAMTAIDELAGEHGFDVFLVNAPIAEVLMQDADFKAYYDNAQIEIDAMIAPLSNVHRILRDPMRFPAERMQNTDHVLGEAIADYTRAVGLAVAVFEQD